MKTYPLKTAAAVGVGPPNALVHDTSFPYETLHSKQKDVFICSEPRATYLKF